MSKRLVNRDELYTRCRLFGRLVSEPSGVSHIVFIVKHAPETKSQEKQNNRTVLLIRYIRCRRRARCRCIRSSPLLFCCFCAWLFRHFLVHRESFDDSDVRLDADASENFLLPPSTPGEHLACVDLWDYVLTMTSECAAQSWREMKENCCSRCNEWNKLMTLDNVAYFSAGDVLLELGGWGGLLWRKRWSILQSGDDANQVSSAKNCLLCCIVKVLPDRFLRRSVCCKSLIVFDGAVIDKIVPKGCQKHFETTESPLRQFTGEISIEHVRVESSLGEK